MPEISALNEYLSARRLGRKYVSEHSGAEHGGKVAILEKLLATRETTGEISLGTHEITIKKIVGTYTDARSNAFSGNFLPLLGEGTEFAAKWQILYSHHIRDGISDPIKVYEYLNRFYVLEGNKRVSVMSYVGAYSIRAEVIRLLPKFEEGNREIEIYYEILGHNPKSFAFNEMWFSKPGTFTELLDKARIFAAMDDDLLSAPVESWLPRSYRDFSRAYEAAGLKNLEEITTGDAFVEYIRVYGIPYELPYDELCEKVRNCDAQFRLIAGQDDVTTIEGVDDPEKRAGRGVFGIGARRARALFVYRTLPEISNWTRSHEMGRLALEEFFEGQVQTSAIYGVDPNDPYPQIDAAAMEQKPDIIFTVNSLFDLASLQIALENPQTIVFNCNHSRTGLRLNTYYTKLYEQTFLLGAIAAAYTKTNIIGFIDLPARATDSTYAINAFSQGARLVNHNIRVKRCKLSINYSGAEDRLARKRLAESGADVVLCQYPTYDGIIAKPCDDLYGMLCSVAKNGAVIEYLAAPAWNWAVVYRKILSDYLDGTLDILKNGGQKSGGNMHFWLGLSSGAAQIYNVVAALGTHTARLGLLFEEMISSVRLHPFVGPLRDDKGQMRIEKYDTPTLHDIQAMDWLCDIVDETVEL